MTGRVELRKDGPIGWVVFDHAARRNAITVDMWQAIPSVIAEATVDADIRVVILRGAGDIAFVSGADISEFEQTRTGPDAARYDTLTHAAFDALRALDKPLIAMVHGFCVGGGAAIALCADLRVCATDALFAIPPARLGLGYHVGGVEALVRTVGFAGTAELLFTAKRVKAEEAARLGLIQHVFVKDALEDETRALAETIANNAPLTIRAAKIALREIASPAGQRDTEAMQSAIDDCFHSDDFREGVTAFLEKRAPRFSGR